MASFLDDVGIISRSAPQNGMIIIYSLRETGEELDMFLVVFGLAPWKMVVLLVVQAGCMGRWIAGVRARVHVGNHDAHIAGDGFPEPPVAEQATFL